MFKYIVTGYSKKDQRMATHTFSSIEHVAELINQCAESTATTKIINNPKDLDFNVQSRRSHNGAQIIDAGDYVWSIFLLK